MHHSTFYPKRLLAAVLSSCLLVSKLCARLLGQQLCPPALLCVCVWLSQYALPFHVGSLCEVSTGLKVKYSKFAVSARKKCSLMLFYILLSDSFFCLL